VREGLGRDPGLVSAVARTLLDAHFPPSVHEDIVAAVGLDLDAPPQVRTARDRAFREAVLVAYQYSCAVCRVGVRLGDAPVGVEAAHIRWHASGGPDEVKNGLCLCSLHHKLFDRGALTLSPDGQQVWVSERANGQNVERALGRFHGRKVARPNRVDDAPSPVFVAWHHKEVFQGRPRD
jgi:putative restriction endonuclease